MGKPFSSIVVCLSVVTSGTLAFEIGPGPAGAAQAPPNSAAAAKIQHVVIISAGEPILRQLLRDLSRGRRDSDEGPRARPVSCRIDRGAAARGSIMTAATGTSAGRTAPRRRHPTSTVAAWMGSSVACRAPAAPIPTTRIASSAAAAPMWPGTTTAARSRTTGSTRRRLCSRTGCLSRMRRGACRSICSWCRSGRRSARRRATR